MGRSLKNNCDLSYFFFKSGNIKQKKKRSPPFLFSCSFRSVSDDADQQALAVTRLINNSHVHGHAGLCWVASPFNFFSFAVAVGGNRLDLTCPVAGYVIEGITWEKGYYAPFFYQWPAKGKGPTDPVKEQKLLCIDRFSVG